MVTSVLQLRMAKGGKTQDCKTVSRTCENISFIYFGALQFQYFTLWITDKTLIVLTCSRCRFARLSRGH